MPRMNARPRVILGLAALGAYLAACGPDRAVTGSVYPYEHRERHPIVLADAPRTLDVFVTGQRLDPRQRDDLYAFALEYRRYGQNAMTVQMPAGPVDGALLARAFDDVRAELAEAGVDPSRLAVASYPVADSRMASPIRLSFRRMQAKVAGRCGLFPQDLGGTDPSFNASNAPYWNFGCSSQTNLANQVADPIDLVRGRSEAPGDTLRRSKGVKDFRDGKDPSTPYRQDDQGRINPVGR